jgi:chaperonin GroES
MAMDFVPLHGRVLVRRIEEQETTHSGLVIPDTAKEKPQEGEVLATGKGKIKDDGKILPLDVKLGDRILFGKYAGTNVRRWSGR